MFPKKAVLFCILFVCCLLVLTLFNTSGLFSYGNSSNKIFFTHKSYHDYLEFQTSALRSHTNVIIFVATSPSNIDRRNAVRSTWADQNRMQYSFSLPKPLKGYDEKLTSTLSVLFIVKFLLGVSGSVEMDNRLKAENLTYGDIVFGDFVEGYFKLSAKTDFMLRAGAVMMGASKNSAPSFYQFLVKADDDAYVDLEVFARVISQTASINAYGGLCRSDNKPKRSITSKFYLSPSSYPYKYFPPYCEGPFYYLSHDLVSESVNSSRVLREARVVDDKILTSISKFEDVMVGFYIFFRNISRASRGGLFRENQTVNDRLQPIPEESMFMFVSSENRRANVFKNFLSSNVSCRKIRQFPRRIIAYHPVSSASMGNVHNCLTRDRRHSV